MAESVIRGDSGWDSDFATATAYIVDRQTSATLGGTATAGSWATRVLNSIEEDAQSIVSIASNEFTLQAGTYEIEWESPFFACNRGTTRLFNVTDTAVVIEGTSRFSISTAQVEVSSQGFATVTLASAKALRI